MSEEYIEKQEVDFVPKTDIQGNMLKIKNYVGENLNDHLLINNIITALKMYPGKNREFPGVGFAELILEIGASYRSKTDANTLIDELQSEMKAHYGRDITIEPEYSELEDFVTLKIDVGELPGKIVTTVSKKNGTSTTITSKYV